jgi:Lar family restriction alleviation protein
MPSKTKKLNKCPFCGMTLNIVVKAIELPPPQGQAMAIFCENCDCRGPWGNTQTIAIKLWNSRSRKKAR